MSEEKVKLPTVKIQGKDYTLVKDRIVHFNDTYPNGAIRTSILSEIASEKIVIMASIIPDVSQPEREFIGHSQAVVGEGHINRTAALENAETSAVGRALAMMGIGVIESVASADEVNKARGTTPRAVLNKQITNADLPDQMFDQSSQFVEPSRPLEPAAVDAAVHLENFVPLTESRNKEIQERLKQLVTDKTLDRRKLQVWLDSRHDNKRAYEVHANTWEETMSLIEKAVQEGADSVKALLKK